MRVVIIGAGNVATVLGRLMREAGHEIVQVVNRSVAHARVLANELGCAFTSYPGSLDNTADIYVAAISDAALEEIPGFYMLRDKLIVHTAGSVSKDILKSASVNYGVMYPLQSLRKEYIALRRDIPLLIDGSSADVKAMIEKFAQTLSPVVAIVSDEQRLKLHVAAVIVSNFTNHLYTLAADYCSREELDFNMLHPLIEETALRLRLHLPGDVQTGPAARKDIITLEKHLNILSAHPALKEIYGLMSESIMAPLPPKGGS